MKISRQLIHLAKILTATTLNLLSEFDTATQHGSVEAFLNAEYSHDTATPIEKQKEDRARFLNALIKYVPQEFQNWKRSEIESRLEKLEREFNQKFSNLKYLNDITELFKKLDRRSLESFSIMKMFLEIFKDPELLQGAQEELLFLKEQEFKPKKEILILLNRLIFRTKQYVKRIEQVGKI